MNLNPDNKKLLFLKHDCLSSQFVTYKKISTTLS